MYVCVRVFDFLSLARSLCLFSPQHLFLDFTTIIIIIILFGGEKHVHTLLII